MAEVKLEKGIKRYGTLEVVHGIDLKIDHNEFVFWLGLPAAENQPHCE